MADEKTHLAAVVAFLTSVDANPLTLAQLEAMAEPPAYYTEVTVTQRVGSGPRRAGSASEVTQWRILTRAVAKVYGNAQEMRARASALHEATLTVDGERFVSERSATDDPIAPDDGWWSGVSEFTY